MGWRKGSQPSKRRRAFAALALFLIPFALYQSSLLYTRGCGGSCSPFSQAHVSATDHIYSPEVQEYWRILRDQLLNLTPTARRIQTQQSTVASGEEEAEDFEDYPDQDLVRLDDAEFKALRDSHDRMVKLIPYLSPHLPYRNNTRGIVMTAEGKHIGMILFSIRMLRRTGSELPVVVFLHTYADYSSFVCEELFPDLNAECVVFSDLLDTAPPSEPLNAHQLKVFALMFAPFQELLFLNPDTILASSPDELFEVESYRSSGLVSWPDDRDTVTSSLFYGIARTRSPHFDKRRSRGSDILLYDKYSHAEDLLLALYYNFFGPGWFYPLLSQAGSNEGDRKTFVLAAKTLGAPYYDVKRPMIHMETALPAGRPPRARERGHATEKQDFHWARQVPAALGGIRTWLGDTVLGQKALEIVGEWKTDNIQKEGSREARPFFLRSNNLKMDIKSLLESCATAEHRNQRGYTQRSRRPESELGVDGGAEIERVLWEELGGIATQMLERDDGHRR